VSFVSTSVPGSFLERREAVGFVYLFLWYALCIIQTNCVRGICIFCLRRTKKHCSSVQATHAVLLSFTRKTCKFRLYRIVFGELYLKSNLSCLATVFDTDYIFEILCPNGNAPYFIILMSRFCLSRGECCPTSYPGLFSSAVGWSAKKALASAGLFLQPDWSMILFNICGNNYYFGGTWVEWQIYN
jgi:hypothetical protein